MAVSSRPTFAPLFPAVTERAVRAPRAPPCALSRSFRLQQAVSAVIHRPRPQLRWGQDAGGVDTGARGGLGSECRERLRVSDTEASISLPVAKLVETFGARWKLSPRLHPEYSLPEARVRPDYAVETSGRITGFLELKAPGHDVTPDGFTKRDREQWALMRRLPNVLYSNGHTWCLYRGGSRPLRTARLEGDLYRSGSRLRTSAADGAAFRDLLREFLGWQPRRITTVGQLVSSGQRSQKSPRGAHGFPPDPHFCRSGGFHDTFS